MRSFRSPAGRRTSLTGMLFVAPALLFSGVFMAYPLADLFWLSVHDYSPLRSAHMSWVGLANFRQTLGDPQTHVSIYVTSIFTLVSVSLEMLVGLLSAVCLANLTLYRGGRFHGALNRVFVGVFILPLAAPTVVAAVVWKMLLDPEVGPIDAILGAPIAWFSDFALPSVIVADAWKTFPFITFLLFSAIVSIDPLQFEAAKLDGANAWQEFWHLTLPSILPIFSVTAAFRTVDAFTKAFDIVFATTSGGPGDDTMVFPLYIWRSAFSSLHFGQASALAVIALLISGAAGTALLLTTRPKTAQ